MSKPVRKSLSAALTAANEGRKPVDSPASDAAHPTKATVKSPSPVAESESATAKPESTPTPKRKSRAKKTRQVHLGGYFDPVVHKQFKLLAVEKDLSVQDLMREALNLVFTKYKKPPIA